MYTCPMHPEIKSDTPGRCSKCGMDLVPISNNQQSLSPEQNNSPKSNILKDYQPLIVIISFIALITIILTLRNLIQGNFSLEQTMSYFMAGFFLTFSAVKFMDLKGFAQAYSTYDLLAQKLSAYGYIYPVLELLLGVGYILFPGSNAMNTAAFSLMTFSGIGVGLNLLRGNKFNCACLGTLLKVPLTKVTLIEDFGMALMALLMILI
jgi:hypothetical protein